MNTKVKLLGLLLIGLISCQSQYAQSPKTDNNVYTNAEINLLLQKYHSQHSRDVIPPSAIQQKFNSDFPSALDIDWEVSENIYEVEFEIKRKDYKAFYDDKGNLLMYSQEISKTELPAVIKNIAESKHPKYKFEDIKIIRKGSETFYKIEMEHRDVEVKFVLTENGSTVNERFDY